MSQEIKPPQESEDIYADLNEWHINVGGQKVVAKRMGGRFRVRKWMGMAVWALFFLMPYLRWNGAQAILLDFPNRQFNFFSTSIYPQDVWMLSLTLLFFAILLAAVTSVAGRVFCGYFCFQTVWTDIYTLIEGALEGKTPQKAKKFNDAPWTTDKIIKKVTKHGLWLLIAFLTGITFVGWFTDIYQLWIDCFTLQASIAAWIVIFMFIGGTYVFAGFMREQVCFWLCPYARLQGVMYDGDTILPAYDAKRGESRGKLKRGDTTDNRGSCVDCRICVAVCPTGIDIRQGQQEGCITCGLCIDACDDIMDKTGQERGLIRYASHNELHEGKKEHALWKRPRVLVYGVILLASSFGIVYGLASLSSTEFNVLHERQPLFVKMSNGDIQNKYTLKLLNKTKEPLVFQIGIEGVEGANLVNSDILMVEAGKAVSRMALVRVPKKQLTEPLQPIIFKIKEVDDPNITATYKSMFIGPK